ncbi:MAG: orotidine 5'-phosphate decarboxylase [Candidatus Methanoperedens nitroreducens]|uniref:Orotidine 5'-phosphate decarboxylase n=1 Tax=Candidatus Methanoperedens nitratireducens TaxID=1392998 RepID=A0A0P8CG18_9EURY|nr:MAG: orotidine 5'-phosphate decarboxylase [Candidatus Methanoperedens sp. BLZ1]CAG1006879.1 orotidine-5'-phosphate decarboxylase [Methanosarcinales archaeon]
MGLKDVGTYMESLRRNTQLIMALDVTDKKKARAISKETAQHVDAIKIGYPLVLGAGLEIINDICEFAPVIADFKVADIPNTDGLICSQTFEAGASAVIVHGFTGHDSVLECVKTAKDFQADIFVVTEMSHPGAVEFMQPKALELASLAVECKASGVVAPATRPERLRKIRDVVGGLTIISPGVGAQGGSAADAIKAGADYVIVGRSIYNSRNPGIEAERIVKEIEKCR